MFYTPFNATTKAPWGRDRGRGPWTPIIWAKPSDLHYRVHNFLQYFFHGTPVKGSVPKNA